MTQYVVDTSDRGLIIIICNIDYDTITCTCTLYVGTFMHKCIRVLLYYLLNAL